jgi:hypothetical protein
MGPVLWAASAETSTPLNEHPMHAPIRRFESIDRIRASELVAKPDEDLPASSPGPERLRERETRKR